MNELVGSLFQTKLGKLIRLLASDQPGEVVAAADAINRSLRSAGADIHTLAEVVEQSPLVPRQYEKPHNWRDTVEWCAGHEGFLSERERKFISSMAHWRGRPTEKQMNWLLLIEQKIRARQAR